MRLWTERAEPVSPTSEPVSSEQAPRPRQRERAPARSEHELASGRRVQIDRAASLVQIASPDGQVELTLRSTPDGCVLSFSTLSLALSTPGKLDVRCEELVVNARRLELNAEGDYSARVSGNCSTRVSGRMETEADELFFSTTRGDALIQANDYVRLVGEKILLNSEQERRPTRDQLEAFWRRLGL